MLNNINLTYVKQKNNSKNKKPVSNKNNSKKKNNNTKNASNLNYNIIVTKRTPNPNNISLNNNNIINNININGDFLSLSNNITYLIKDHFHNNKLYLSNIKLISESINEQTLFSRSAINDILLYLNQIVKPRYNNTMARKIKDHIDELKVIKHHIQPQELEVGEEYHVPAAAAGAVLPFCERAGVGVVLQAGPDADSLLHQLHDGDVVPSGKVGRRHHHAAAAVQRASAGDAHALGIGAIQTVPGGHRLEFREDACYGLVHLGGREFDLVDDFQAAVGVHTVDDGALGAAHVYSEKILFHILLH